MNLKFQNEQGIWYTNGLFIDYCVHDDAQALYTTQPEDVVIDGKTYLSLRGPYLELEDPTEYEFAIKYFASWAHWLKVKDSARIKKSLSEWQEELEVKLRSRGVKGIYDKMAEGDYQASKWLAEKGWVARGERTRGAPTKAAVLSEARKSAKVVGLVDAHYDRMKKKER